jgi:hypothetical protein
MSDVGRFEIKELEHPEKLARQGCSCGGSVLAKKELAEAARERPVAEPAKA